MGHADWLPRLRLANVFAAATFALIVVRAVLTVDPYWDTLAYHWPFAARAAGICDRNCFLMSPGLEARYDGFPLLLHLLQGFLWRVTGTPGLADLINIGMLAGLCVYLRRRFAVPLAWSWLAFLAIPEVQIQLTSSYIDLPLNAAVTLALMVILRMLVEPTADQRADIAIALVALGIAAESKFQMVPIALLAWAVIVVLAARNTSNVKLKHRSVTFIALSLVGAIVLLPKLVLNTVTFGNPFYPIAIALGPIRVPGPESMMQSTSISDAWIRWPGPIRWLASVLEFDAFRGRPLPWTLGQGDVLQSSPSFRMGGYFGGYVLGSISLVVWAARSTSAARWPVVLIVLISILCACLPLSHELRYYMFWMLTLVAVSLALVYAPLFTHPEQEYQRKFSHGLVAIAVASVFLMTGGAYLRPWGPTLPELLHQTKATIAQLPDGVTLCVLNGDRWAFLYSSVLHPPHKYQTRVLGADEADPQCAVRLDLGSK